MNVLPVFLLIFGLICSANGFRIVPFPNTISFPGLEDSNTIQDSGKFFLFSGAVEPNESSSQPPLTPTPANPPPTTESAVTTTSSTETIFLVPLSDTIFVPDYLISSASLYAAAAPSEDYPNPPKDTRLPSNLELAEITDTIRADLIADYVQNYPLANNLQQHYPITKEQMLLTHELYPMDFVNKTKIKPATSINNFHVNQQQRQQRSQQHLTKRSEYQQPFENLNISSYSSVSNINAPNSSVDEQLILTNETDGQAGNAESAEVETTTDNSEEYFGASLYSATFDFFEKANTTIIEEFLDENGRQCIAEQLMFYSRAYFRYTCEGELFQASNNWKSDVAPSKQGVVDTARPTLPNVEDDAISAAQVNSSSLPADLHNFHSFYLKRRAT